LSKARDKNLVWTLNRRKARKWKRIILILILIPQRRLRRFPLRTKGPRNQRRIRRLPNKPSLYPKIRMRSKMKEALWLSKTTA